MPALPSDGRERLLQAVAEAIPPERVEEVHLFAPIRQGGRESGVAVVAAWPEPGAAEPGAAEPIGDEPSDDSWLDTDAPIASPEASENAGAILERSEPPDGAAAPGRPDRLTIYRASYRLTLKGVERGKWEVEVRAEADAPLATAEEVVRGVLRRSGEPAETERLSGEEFRAIVRPG